MAAGLGLLLLAPTAALADNECGVGADVTCTTAGNPYPNGVTYIVPGTDQTLRFENGVIVDSSAGFNPGIFVIQGGADAITIDGPTNVSVTAGSGGGFGVLLASNDGDITVNLDKIANTQANVSGILLSSATGDVSFTGNSVTTTRTGIDAGTNSGNIAVKVGTVTTSEAGSEGITALSQGPGNGNVSVVANTVKTTGAGSTGISATTTSGTLLVDAGSVTTTGAGSTGIVAADTLGVAVVKATTVTTTGAAANGVVVNPNRQGGASVTLGSVSATGAGSSAVQVFGSKTLSVTTTGAVTSDATAITASTLPFFAFPPLTGPGTATVSTSGDVTSTKGDGINAFAQAGNISVTTAAGTTVRAAGSGVRAVSNGLGDGGVDGASDGNVTITNGANIGTAATPVGGIGLDAQITNVGSKGAVLVTNTGAVNSTGIGIRATNAGLGGATVNATGSVATTGAGSTGILLTSATGAAAVKAGAVTTKGALANGVEATGSDATATVTGPVSATGAGSSGVVLNATGGKASLTNSGTVFGTINGASLTSVTGSTITNSGTLDGTDYAFRVAGGAATVTNSGTVNQRFSLTANADTFSNSGTVNAGQSSDFGADADVFNNSGTVRVAPTAVVATNVAFTGLETFNNTGLVDMRNGHTGDVFTLGGAFAGAGASALGLDATLSANVATADRLVLAGAATGSTAITVSPIGAGPAVLNPGVIVVQAGAASTATAFTVAPASQQSGFIQYGIVYNPATFAYSLTGAPNVSAYRPLLFAEMIRNTWNESADAVSGHMQSTRDFTGNEGTTQSGLHFWGQVYGGSDRREDVRTATVFGQTTNFDLGSRQNYVGEQLGAEYTWGGPRGGATLGVTGGFLTSRTRFGGQTFERMDLDVGNAGVYASTHIGPFFVNGLAKADRYWGSVSSAAAGYNQDVEGWTYGARGEIGLHFDAGGFFIEPTASLSYVDSSLDDFTQLGATFAFEEDAGLRGRAGGRIGTSFTMMGMRTTAYIGGNYVHEFMGEDSLTFSSGNQSLVFANPQVEDYGEGVIGLSSDSVAGLSAFAEGRYAGGGGLEGYRGRVGLRMRY